MKVFFHSSIFAKDQLEDQYLSIVKICKSLNHQIYSDHILKRTYHDTDKFTRKQHQQDFQNLTRQIKESDAVIIEGTTPSIGTGHYLTIALSYLKPVLVLYENKPHGILVGDPNRLLILKKYSLSNKKGLNKIIDDFLKSAQNKILRNRFNLMLDDEMTEFLERQSKENKTSKANVLRRLMLEKIAKIN